ncbi:MAG: ATP-binding protein [Inhella sp.]
MLSSDAHPTDDAAALAAWRHSAMLMAWFEPRDGTILRANPALKEWLGIVGHADLAQVLGHADMALEVWAHLRAGRDWHTRLKLDNGQGARWFQVSVRQPPDEGLALLTALPVRAPDEELAESQSALVSHLSHELRTPLTGVISLTELVLSSTLGDRQRKLLDMALQSGRNLLELINHTLDLAKVDAGAMKLDVRAFALHDCLRDALQPLLAGAHAKGVQLQARVQPGVPNDMVGDPLRLRQVLGNLVGNALKFTAKGQVRVDVSRISQTGSRLRLRFAITDTGLGMTPAQVQQLFAPFAQADASIARRFGGTGLGLMISQRLVGLMGGSRIDVESSPGVGSCFSFEVECQRAASPLGPPPPPRPADAARNAVR